MNDTNIRRIRLKLYGLDNKKSINNEVIKRKDTELYKNLTENHVHVLVSLIVYMRTLYIWGGEMV